MPLTPAERARRWRERHPEYKIIAAARQRAYYKRNAKALRERERPRDWRKNLKKRYGITEAEYDAMLAKQNGVCAMCGGPNKLARRLGVDHNHTTGQVRGILCISCNAGLGFFEKMQSQLAKYLEEYDDTLITVERRVG